MVKFIYNWLRRFIMGRSQLQGTPWHYEYNKGTGINNSKNCAYNTGNRCACKISPNHNLQCIGKLNCEEFERWSKRSSITGNSSKKTPKVPTTYTEHLQSKTNYKTCNKKKVEIGSRVTIKCDVTGELIELGVITSKDNLFYSKEIKSSVLVKGLLYKIVKIV